MRKIRICAHVSLDGVIQPAGDDEWAKGGWSASYRSPAGAAALVEAQGKPFDLLLGRRTYDLWSTFWPEMKGGPFADALNAATKYVATHRRSGFEWGPFEDLGPDVVEGIRAVKAKGGPDLVVWGSTELTPLLFEHGLVDEVVLAVYPLLLGQGIRFFSDRVRPQELAFVTTFTAPTGALLTTYRYVGPAQASA